jgi:PAS domain S-box-containing protein
LISPAPFRPTILMVDDRVENLVALEAVLQPLGHRLVRASSGPDALREVLRTDFAVILMDVQMPDMNGFETAHVIKSRRRSRDVPIIFLTAISKDERYVFQGYSVGAVDYIFKPFEPDILRSKVTVFVDLFLKQREIERQGELLREGERRELELRHRAGMLEVEARHAQILDSAMDPIVSFGDDRRIRIFNAAARRTFRIQADAAVGRPIEEFLRVADDEILSSLAARVGEGVGPDVREGTGRRADGGEFPAEYTVSTLTMGASREHTLILRDISERRAVEATLRARTSSLADTLEELRAVNDQMSERSRELEHAMGTRNRFYASMSHELRTPINAILGYSSLLLDGIFGELEPQQRDSIDRTFAAANHLQELVNDILDLSKVEAGKMELKMEPVTFPDLVQDLFATVTPLAEEHGVELILEGSEDTIQSDPRRVRQIVLNLLSNAIKFGDGKPVRVVNWREPDGAIAIEVRDQGPGIADADQERIFEEFVQLESAAKPGTGLGLPISRRLAELLGGSLTVRSNPGEGSAFRLTLPRTGSSAPPRPARAAAGELTGRS